MSHYWTADDPPATRQAQIEDWIDDLAGFPAEVIEEACRMWRRANKHRPTPFDIRSLAIAEREYRKPLSLPPPDEANRYVGPEGRCQDRWTSCSERWHARGFICQPSCRERIPDYRTLSEDQVRQRQNPEKHRRERVAAAYRWAHDQGRIIPEDLDDKSRQVTDLVREYEACWAEQDRERAVMLARVTGSGRNADGSPTPEAIDFVEFASRRIRANIRAFGERSTAPFKNQT